MPLHNTNQDFTHDRVPASPRMRINLTEPITLQDNWQRIDFSGDSEWNVNTFPVVTGNNLRSVNWDASGQKLAFHSNKDRTYSLKFNYTIQGGIRPVEINLRFVVPGQDGQTFPLPDGQGHMNLTGLESISNVSDEMLTMFYINEVVRTNGLAIEIKTGKSLLALNRPKLQDGVVTIYGK